MAFGELGLTGAVRPVGHGARRLAAAAAHGMEIAITPPAEGPADPQAVVPGALSPVPEVREALEAAFSR